MVGQPLKPVSSADSKRAPVFWLEALLGIVLGLIVLSWVRLFPEAAAWSGRQLHYGVPILLFFCAVAVAALKVRGFQFPSWSLALVAGILLPQLWWLWHSGISDTMLVGGFLPFSDAAEYLISARVLAGGQRLQGIANNHTLATAMLGSLWKLTQGDYRLILVLITLLGAAAVWLAMVEVSLLLGAGAAVAWLFVDILFLRRFIGVPLSEHLGLILGNLGLALGCRAVRKGNAGNWVLAMFSITLALCARPGAMLTIPALFVGAFLSMPRGQPRRWVLPFAMVLAAVAAVLVNNLVSHAVGKPESVSVSYAVYILHSIVLGGTWKDALNRYGDNRIAAWNAVTAQITAHPMSLVAGIARSLSAFVLRGYLFSFVIFRWLNVLLHLAFIAGVVAVLSKLRSDRRVWWLFAFLAGLAASMPLLPPWDTDNMRAYAASIPFIAFTVALGVRATILAFRASRFAPRPADAGPAVQAMPAADGEPRCLGHLSRGLLVVVLLLCALIPPLLRKPDLPLGLSLENTYSAGRSDGSISYSPRVALHLVPGAPPPGMPALGLGNFRAGLGGLGRLFPGEAVLLSTLPGDCALLPGFHEFSFIAIDASHLAAGGGERTVNVQFKFFAEGLMLVAVDEGLLERSAALAAYDSSALGPFSFGLNRFPVLRSYDTASLNENVVSTDFMNDVGGRPNVNPNQPLVLGSQRIQFPLAGEYHLLVNHKYPLKVLVIPRDSTRADSERLISSFVEANCVIIPDNGAVHVGVGSKPDLLRFFESDSPARLTRKSMLELIALLKTGAANTNSR